MSHWENSFQPSLLQELTSHFINLVITVSIFINNIRIKYTTPPEDPCNFTETCLKNNNFKMLISCNVYFSYIDTIHYIDLENKKNQKICVPFLSIFYRLSVTVIFFNNRGMDCWSVRIKNVEFKNIVLRSLTWYLQETYWWWIAVTSYQAQNHGS